MSEITNSRVVPGPENTNTVAQAATKTAEHTAAQAANPVEVNANTPAKGIPDADFAKELAKSASTAGDVRDLLAEASGSKLVSKGDLVNKSTVKAKDEETEIKQILGMDEAKLKELKVATNVINPKRAADQAEALKFQAGLGVVLPFSPFIAAKWLLEQDKTADLKASRDFSAKLEAIETPNLDRFLSKEKLVEIYMNDLEKGPAPLLIPSDVEADIKHQVMIGLRKHSPLLRNRGVELGSSSEQIKANVEKEIEKVLEKKGSSSFMHDMKEPLVLALLGPRANRIKRVAERFDRGFTSKLALGAYDKVRSLFGKDVKEPLAQFIKSIPEDISKMHSENTKELTGKVLNSVVSKVEKNKGLLTQVVDKLTNTGNSSLAKLSKTVTDFVGGDGLANLAKTVNSKLAKKSA